jgi:hypothetical protein
MVKQWKDRTDEWSSGPMGVIAVYSGLVFGQRWKVHANKKKKSDRKTLSMYSSHADLFIYLHTLLQPHPTGPLNCLSCPVKYRAVYSFWSTQMIDVVRPSIIQQHTQYHISEQQKLPYTRGLWNQTIGFVTRFMGNNPLFLKWQAQVKWRIMEWRKPMKSKQTGILHFTVKLQFCVLYV